MLTLLIFLVLFAVLQPAAATNPVIDPVLFSTHMESHYPDPDGMLDTFCRVCGTMLLTPCMHVLEAVMRRNFTTEIVHQGWPTVEVPPEPTLQPQDLIIYNSEPQPQPLIPENLDILDSNATSVQPETIYQHVADIYTPGDRTVHKVQRRYAPQVNGFVCDVSGCTKSFNRNCELTRHKKNHKNPCDRPHKCIRCGLGFLYPKDRNRHQRTHDQPSSPSPTLYCQVAGCNNDGFSRRDNMLRHHRKQHPNDPVPPLFSP